MSRVHDALRRAEMGGMMPPDESPVDAEVVTPGNPDLRAPDLPVNGAATAAAMAPSAPLRLNIRPSMFTEGLVVPFSPAPESHLLDLNNSHETPAEEFRKLRTRLNHFADLHPVHRIRVTRPS